MSERRHRQSAATKLPAGGRVPGHEGLRIVQLLPQDVRAGGDEGREKRRAGGAGGGGPASREEGLLLVTASRYCSQTG